MNPVIVAAIARHLLTAIGGGFAVKYGVDGSTMDAIVGGLASLAGVLWSVADKRNIAQNT